MTEPTATELGMLMKRVSATLCIVILAGLGRSPGVASATTLPVPANPTYYEMQSGDDLLVLNDHDGLLTIPRDIYNLTYAELAPGHIDTQIQWDARAMYKDGHIQDDGAGQYIVVTVGRTEGETLGYAINNPGGYPAAGSVYTELNGSPIKCLIWRLSYLNWGQVIYESACVPVHWVVPVSCSMDNEQVLIDHGTVASGTASTAETAMSITCSGPATARLSLPDGTSSLPVGSGSSSLTAQGAPIGGPITLKKGPNEVVVQSVLRGVGAGQWSSSVPIVLSVD